MRPIVSLVLVLFSASAGAFDCKYQEPRNLDIDVAGLHNLEFKLGSSDLRAEGVPGLKQIEVRGRACASEQDRLAGLSIDQQRVGETVTLTTRQADHQTFSLFGSNYAYVDVDVRFPPELMLQVRTNSGDATVEKVSSLDFTSHSGDLILHHASGAVVVDVHSGDVNVDDVGSLEVRHSGSGDVNAHEVHGEVKVGHVGSGDLSFEGVTKGVYVESIGSGDVTVNHAGASVVVDSIGSGDVNVQSVGGDLIVKSAGSSDIHHHDVKGRVDVPKRNDED